MLWWQNYSGVFLIHELFTCKYYYRVAGECQKMPRWGQAKSWISGWLQGIFNINWYIMPKSLTWDFVQCPHDVHRINDNQVFRVTPHSTLKFHLISTISFLETHSFRIVLSKLPKTFRKLCISTKFPHQEISWNYCISFSETILNFKRIFQKNKGL